MLGEEEVVSKQATVESKIDVSILATSTSRPQVRRGDSFESRFGMAIPPKRGRQAININNREREL